MVTNGKHKKKKEFSLDHENGKIERQANLKDIQWFYMELFGAREDNAFTLI